MLSGLLLVLITVIFPPVGVYLISGCEADLLINICLTILGYFPGHIHAFYLLWVYYDRRELMRQGIVDNRAAPGVYSQDLQKGEQQGEWTDEK
ncbi:hypothetical protein LTR08_002132 [Meristemomyces frigidus]|nr:hypothetical protein LTR08_002132 [Meristemomyces frigidus]